MNTHKVKRERNSDTKKRATENHNKTTALERIVMSYWGLTLWSCQNICDALSYPLDNIYISFSNKLYTQIVGIPVLLMYQNVAELFLFCYEIGLVFLEIGLIFLISFEK